MKIVIPTIGSRGDVQPFIALGQGLLNSGHEVILASHPVMKDLVRSYDVDFQPIGPDIDLAKEVAAIRLKARNTAAGLIEGMRFGFDLLERSHEDILALVRDADLVVVPAAIGAGKNEAEMLKKPYLSVTLMPWSIPWDDPDRPLLKRILYSGIDKLVSLITTRPLNRIRKRLGLPPVGKEGFTSTTLNLIPVSPEVFLPNPLWDLHHHITGYWFADPPSDWKPSKNLLSFLEKGAPPILVSLGAMSLGEEDALETAALFLDAIQQAGVRAVIQGWESGLRQLNLPPGVYAAGPIPQSWLLPRCAGAVHHGGFGTTAACFRAGKPAFVIPHIADQFYWGQRVQEMGVGPEPIQRNKLEIKGLTASIIDLATNSEYQKAAAFLGEKIRAEDGLQIAVRLINETFS